jgi:hypothetical protein
LDLGDLSQSTSKDCVDDGSCVDKPDCGGASKEEANAISNKITKTMMKAKDKLDDKMEKRENQEKTDKIIKEMGEKNEKKEEQKEMKEI